MDIEALRSQIEPFLDYKGYENNSTRQNARSYIKLMLDFMQAKDYPEMNEALISDYLKSYEGTANIGARKRRVQEFYEYVKGAKQMSIPIEQSNIATMESEHIEPVQEQPKPELLKKRGRKKQPENENRTQISTYLSNDVYAGVKALATVSRQTISDIVSRVMKVFYDNNQEAISESIKIIESYKSVELKIKYSR